MFIRLLTLLWSIGIINGKHFNGGTINWAPIDPYDNSSTVPITITQSYSWTYPYISCANNVPISTSGWGSANSNLTCVVDCSTDGGYSTHPMNILTDCTSASASLKMMSSTRSNNITLNAGAHFYLAYVGSAWVGLDNPPQSGLQWSIVTFIDLRMRPDGFINTPPVATVVSPQYAIVNRTVQINIPVSDANAGDDVRCRWSTYTPGYRRRKRSDEEERTVHPSYAHYYKNTTENGETIHIRKKRLCLCIGGACTVGCFCSCSSCDSTICTGISCVFPAGCATASPTIATTLSTTTIATTTIETQGTLKSTSSYPHRQAIDECGDICYPSTVPSGTSISNCTISFTGLTAGVWYAVAIQVEDFINETSTTPMSSVPVQLLIYVMPTPNCSIAPIILPLSGCLEVQVGVAISFDLYAMNLCNSSVANLTDLIVSTSINGMTNGNLTSSPTNSSLYYVYFTWTPQANQIGSQELCTIAYTSELEQSAQYCVTFTVKATPDLCVTTTTTSTTTTSVTTTSTTSASTTTTSETTTTTTSTTTSVTTTSTTSTSTTSSTSSTSTSSTSTTSTTTSTTSTSTTSTSTSTTTTSVTTTTTTTVTTTKAPGSSINWLLILGLSLLTALLALCCCCYFVYRFFWSPSMRRRRQKDKETDIDEHIFEPRYAIVKSRKIQAISTINKNYQIYNRLQATASGNSSLLTGSHINSSFKMNSFIENEGNKQTSAVSVKRIKPIEMKEANDTEDRDDNRMISSISHSEVESVRVTKITKLDIINEDQTKNSNLARQQSSNAEPVSRSKAAGIHVRKVSRNKTTANQRGPSSNIAHETIMNSEIHPVGMQPIRNRSKTFTNNKIKTSNGVTVTKLRRTSSIPRSHH